MTVLPALCLDVQSPDLRAAVESAAAGLFAVVELPATLTDPRTAVAAVADARAVLLVIELGRATQRHWLGVVRSDPATRRVPLIALASTPDAIAEARGYHANAIVERDALENSLRDLLISHARTAPDLTVLSDQCGETPPPLVLKGLHEFNAGEYFECHETLETAWMQERGPVRELYRAILQVGIAYYQITRANYRGAHKMFLRAVQWLAPLPDACQGIDVAQLKLDAAAARSHLEAVGEQGIAAFDTALLKPIRYQE